MSNIVGDEACPECRARGGDKTGNHLIIFKDGNKKCRKCSYFEKGGAPVIAPEEREMSHSKMTVNLVANLPIKEMKARGIKKEVAEYYGVRTEVNEENGEDAAYYYPLTMDGTLKGYRCRRLPKSFSNVASSSLRGCRLDLFGQSVVPAKGKYILLVGGQDDMLAAYQMLHSVNPRYKPKVVSVSSGENLKSVSDNIDYLCTFEHIHICLDNDEVGRKYAREIAALLGEKAALIKLPGEYKDANEMLLAGQAQSFYDAFWAATPYTPDGFVSVEDVYEEATKMPEWGRSWPWPSLTKLTYGRRGGEGIYVGAGVKMGKSAFVNEMVRHIIEVENKKVALFKFEEKPAMTTRLAAGKLMRKPFHKPDGNFTQAELKEGVDKVKPYLIMFDAYMANGDLWEKIKPAIRHAVIVEGCKDVFLDPITTFTDGLTAQDTDVKLRGISNELAALSKDLDFFYYCFCHLKSPQQGASHERGGKVQSSQFRGSRAMMEKTYFMLGIERNKDPELPEEERNTSRFVLLEDRAFGNTGVFSVYYDRETGAYLEVEGEGEY